MRGGGGRRRRAPRRPRRGAFAGSAAPPRRRRRAIVPSSSILPRPLIFLLSLLPPLSVGTRCDAAFVTLPPPLAPPPPTAVRRFGRDALSSSADGDGAGSESVRPRRGRRTPLWALRAERAADDDDADDDDDDELLPPPPPTALERDFGDAGFGPPSPDLTRSEAEGMTVKQLRQQLRLRGLRVSGNKAELVDRLLGEGGSAEAEAEAEAEAATDGSDAGSGDAASDVAFDVASLASVGAISESDIAAVLAPDDIDADADAGVDAVGAATRGKAGGLSPEDAEDALRGAGEKFSDRADRTREPIDVAARLDEDDGDEDLESAESAEVDDAAAAEEGDDGEGSGSSGASPEVWGAEARIVDDYEGRSPVVDGLSRAAVEYRGHDRGLDRTRVRAYVVGSRAAMRGYLGGGERGLGEAERDRSPGARAAARVRDVQARREEESRVSESDFADVDWAPDGGDEAGHYDAVLRRDYGDWGPISATGAQISAQEVAGVLLLSDVYGPLGDAAEAADTRALADKVAFECQPVVVFCPDLFRGDPWEEDSARPGYDPKGRTYEEWRETHDEGRVNADIRAAAATLRERYGVSGVAVFGQCFGGGRALEAAAGWVPPAAASAELDAEEEGGPPLVEPAACVAWYPTRYDPQALFGPESPLAEPPSDTPDSSKGGDDGDEKDADEASLAVMAIFAESDTLPGARRGDAELLKYCLEHDGRIRDCMVKIFPGAEHGFAHQGMARRGEGDQVAEKDAFLEEEFGAGTGTGGGSATGGGGGNGGGDAEVAALLSTAFMETYARVFLPTTGVPVKDDVDGEGADPSWSRDIDMKDLTRANQRDVRKELEDALRTHADVKPDLSRMPDYQYFNEIEDMETLEELPKETWEDKFREAVEDLRRAGVDPTAEKVRKGESGAERRRDAPEEYLKRMKDAYDRGELKSWLADVDMDAPLPEEEEAAPSPSRRMAQEYGEDFTADFLDAMKELRENVPVSPDDGADAAMAKFKEALDSGKLRKLQEVKRVRDAKTAKTREAERERMAETAAKLKELGIDEEDSMNDKFRKLKEAYDRGDADGLAGLPLGALTDGQGRGDEEDEWEAGAKDGGLW